MPAHVLQLQHINPYAVGAVFMRSLHISQHNH
jgi:hypothetical protein